MEEDKASELAHQRVGEDPVVHRVREIEVEGVAQPAFAAKAGDGAPHGLVGERPAVEQVVGDGDAGKAAPLD